MLTPTPIARSGFIASGNVGWPHHASGSVRSGHVANTAVASGNVASGSIGFVHLANASVLSGTLGSGQVASGHLASGLVFFLQGSVNSGTVGSGAIASGAVQGFFGTTRNIASGTVGVFDLGSGAVVAGTVGSGAIQSGNIASGQVGSYHIATGAVRGATTSLNQIYSGSLTGYDFNSQGVSLRAIGQQSFLNGPLLGGYVAATVVSGQALLLSVQTWNGETDPSDNSPVAVYNRNRTSLSSPIINVNRITTPVSMIVSSGSTLGTTDNLPFRLWVNVVDEGSGHLSVFNGQASTSVYSLREDRLWNAVAEGGNGGADSAGVLYSDSIVSGAIRSLCYMEWTSGLATAGKWDLAPSIIQYFTPGLPGLPGTIANSEIASGGLVGLLSGFGIASGSFTGFELGSGSIVSGRIASGQVGRNHLGSGAVYNNYNVCGGRLSAQSGAPIASGASGAVDVYLVPYNGNTIQLVESGSNQINWYMFDNVRMNLSGQLASGQAYDIYAVVSGGGVALDKAAWTNASGIRNPGTAVEYNVSGGFWAKSGVNTQRLVGTIYAYFSGLFDDGNLGRFGVWNANNRVWRNGYVYESGANWNYSTAAWRQMNASSGNQIDVVAGLAGVGSIDLDCSMIMATTTAASCGVGVGDNTTTSPAMECLPGYISPGTVGVAANATAVLHKQVSLGRHIFTALELGGGVGTQTWYSQISTSGLFRTGLNCMWEC